MGARGRNAGAELAMPSPTVKVERPDAPYDLTDEEAEEWWAVVNRMPADWFLRETHALLTAYCRHVVEARHVAQEKALFQKTIAEHIEAAEDTGGKLAVMVSAQKVMDRYRKMQERESRAKAMLATKLRISQQATYDPKKKKPLQVKRPWET